MDSNISKELNHVHILVKVDVVYELYWLKLLLNIELLVQMGVQVVNKVVELVLKAINVMFQLIVKHLLSLSFASTGVSNKASCPTKQ